MELLRTVTGRVLIEGHRGAEGIAIENSWQAIEAGYAAGADILELDVQCSSDGYPLLYHNYFIPDGRRFHEVTRAELADVRHKGQPLVPLDDVLDWSDGKPIALGLDIKNGFGFDQQIFAIVYERIQRYHAANRIVVLAWDHWGLRSIKQHDPHITTLALIRGRPINMIEMVRACRADAINLDADMVCANDVSAAHAAGVAVVIAEMYDPNYERAAQMGADVICCKDPGAARRALAQHQAIC